MASSSTSAPVKGRLVVVAVPAGVALLGDAVYGRLEAGVPSAVAAMVGVTTQEGSLMVAGVTQLAAPATPGMKAIEPTARLEPMITRLAHFMIALLSAEAMPRRAPE
jgi:hypothetical protein